MKILILNGPNLNLLGKREPQIYGNRSFENFLQDLQDTTDGADLHYFQSNHEGALIDRLHEADSAFDGVVINAGAYSHTSIALADAVGSISVPVVELHISNVYRRESFRQHSFLSAKCVGCIVGLGLDGYRLAVDYLVRNARALKEPVSKSGI